MQTRFRLEFHRQKHLVRWAKDWVVFLSKIICSARTEYYKRFNGSVSKVKRRGRRSFFEKRTGKRKGEQSKHKTARTDDGNVGCYFSIIDVSSTIYIFIKGQG